MFWYIILSLTVYVRIDSKNRKTWIFWYTILSLTVYVRTNSKIQEKKLEAKFGSQEKQRSIGLCLSFKKDLEAKKKKNESGWICIEEIMLLVDDNCL